MFWFPKGGIFNFSAFGVQYYAVRILTSKYRNSKLPPSLWRTELGPSYSEINRVRMWLNYIGELQEMSLIKIIGKGEGIDYWPHPLQPHIQSGHLFHSYSYSYFLPPPPPRPRPSLQLQPAIGLDNLDFLPSLVPV